MRDANAPPALVDGLVVVESQPWCVRTPPEFLFLSAWNWMEDAGDGFSSRPRDEGYWRELGQAALSLRRLIDLRAEVLGSAAQPRVLAGVTGVRFRDVEEAESYMRALVRFGDVPLSLEIPEFVFRMHGGAVQLLVGERLARLAASGGLAPVSVVGEADLRRIGQLYS